jgi:hypothetical protein
MIMNARLKKIVDDVLELPPSEQQLVDRLVHEERETRLFVEIERRRVAVASGETKMLSREEANESLAKRRLTFR